MEFHSHNIIIADNQFLISESLKKLLADEFSIHESRTVNNKQDLLEALNQKPDSLLIMDPDQIDLDDFSEIRKILLDYSSCMVLVLTNSLSKNELSALNAAGIKNILLKTADRDEILMAFRSVLSGKKYYCQEVLDMFTEIHQEKGIIKENNSLTGSEIEIVRYIAEGFTTKQIAVHKHISYHTVMTHRKNIFRKLNVNNASELVMYAIRAGIIDTIEYHI
jgi:DNA-binding NarL/FixJ family response regulator